MDVSNSLIVKKDISKCREIGKSFNYLVNPQLSNNDIIDGCGHFLPGVMVTRLGELTVGGTQGRDRQILATKFAAHCEVLPQCPTTPFGMVR